MISFESSVCSWLCYSCFFTFKYQFQYHSDGTLTSNEANGFFFIPTLLCLLIGYELRKGQIALWHKKK